MFVYIYLINNLIFLIGLKNCEIQSETFPLEKIKL